MRAWPLPTPALPGIVLESLWPHPPACGRPSPKCPTARGICLHWPLTGGGRYPLPPLTEEQTGSETGTLGEPTVPSSSTAELGAPTPPRLPSAYLRPTPCALQAPRRLPETRRLAAAGGPGGWARRERGPAFLASSPGLQPQARAAPPGKQSGNGQGLSLERCRPVGGCFPEEY